MHELIEIAQSWLAAMNEHNIDKMSGLCWEDAVGDEVAEPELAIGAGAIANSYRELFEAFPDCKAEVINAFAGRDQVLTEVRWYGTNKAAFRGTPATGRVVDIRIAYIFELDGSRIRKITEYYDGATVAAQMGL